jgi:hypothetical protein
LSRFQKIWLAEQDAVALVEQQLQRQQRRFTLTEAAAMTGLAIDTAREALEALLTKYVCRLQVSEYGDLIYNFGETLRRRAEFHGFNSRLGRPMTGNENHWNPGVLLLDAAQDLQPGAIR